MLRVNLNFLKRRNWPSPHFTSRRLLVGLGLLALGVAWASGRDGGQHLTLDLGGGVTMELALIPAGTFIMGSPATEEGRDDNETQHEVTISKPFYIGIHEVTQAQWKTVLGTDPSEFKGADRPVEQVSWYDALEFCNSLTELVGKKHPELKLKPYYTITVHRRDEEGQIVIAEVREHPRNRGFRLPTEAQWEYACRAGTTGPIAGTGRLDDMGWYAQNATRRLSAFWAIFRLDVVLRDDGTRRVGTKWPNAWGLYDMHGNVWEWCSDWHGAYPKCSVTDPTGAPSDTSRVLRGGGWFRSPDDCRSANRLGTEPDDRLNSLGFRVCLDLNE